MNLALSLVTDEEDSSHSKRELLTWADFCKGKMVLYYMHGPTKLYVYSLISYHEKTKKLSVTSLTPTLRLTATLETEHTFI